MRKNSTWEALALAIAQYESLSSTGEAGTPEKSPRGTNHPLLGSDDAEAQEKSPRGTNPATTEDGETPLEVWHLDSPDWRDQRIGQMAEWHPCFGTIERKLRFSTAFAEVALKGYVKTLLSETADEPEDLLRHLHEEVVTYLANKLVEAIDEVWQEVEPVTPRPYYVKDRFSNLSERLRVGADSAA